MIGSYATYKSLKLNDLIKTGRKLDYLEKDLLPLKVPSPLPHLSSSYLYLTSTGIVDPCFEDVSLTSQS